VGICEQGDVPADFIKGNPWSANNVLKFTFHHEVWYGTAYLISQDNLT
jgi:hypothetical protein